MIGYSREELRARQRVSMKLRRERLVAEHRCYNCAGQDERTLSGMRYCARCQEVVNLKHRERTARYKEQHLCVACGEQDESTLSGHSRCAKCLEKERIANRARREKKKGEQEWPNTQSTSSL